MKTENFSKSLNNINEKYIDETVNYKAGSDTKRMGQNKSLKVWRIIAITACSLLAVSITGVVIIAAGTAGKRYKNDAYEYTPDNGRAAAYEPDSDGKMYYDGTGGITEDGSNTQSASGSGSSVIFENGIPENANAKMIYTVNVRVTTTRFDESCKDIESAVKANGGYCESMDVSNSSSSYRNAFYTMRIPSENLDAFLQDAEKSSSIASISKNAEDVSADYYDIETRLTTEKAKLARLNELIAAANDISDILIIEDQIFETQRTIDELSGSLKSYDSKVDYSTVIINLEEVYKITSSDNPLTFGEKISQAFSNGISGFGNFLEDVAIWFASTWIWMLIIAVVVAAVVIILVRTLRKK